jgi:hypothetical protein
MFVCWSGLLFVCLGFGSFEVASFCRQKWEQENEFLFCPGHFDWFGLA